MPSPFVALISTEETAFAVGVPLMTPVFGSTVNPSGNPTAPYPVGLCVAVIVYVKALVLLPFAVSGLVIRGAFEMVISKTAEPLPAEFSAKTLASYAPFVVGVPLMRPVAVSTVNPSGRSEASKFVGPLAAVIW
jgi:hypothetical protein